MWFALFVLCIFTIMGWVTIKTYNFAHEAVIDQHILKDAGIETHLMDELSIQANPIYSNALGGVKLQVWANAVEEAEEVLSKQYVAESISREHNTDEELEKIAMQADEVETEIHLETKKDSHSWSIYITLAGILTIIIFIAYYSQPRLQQEIIRYRWCINYAVIKSEKLLPRTIGVPLKFNGTCQEGMLFDVDGNMYMPGFGTQSSYGRYTLTKNKINIDLYDIELQKLNGNYDIKLDNGNLTLESPNVSIYSSASR